MSKLQGQDNGGWSTALKFVVLFATVGVLSFGLCGVSVLNGTGGDQWWSDMANVTSKVFFLSVAGLVISLIYLAGSKRRGDGGDR